MFEDMRSELSEFYAEKLHGLHAQCDEKCREALMKSIGEDLSAAKEKAIQYGVIAENLSPVLFRSTDYFCEVCANEAIEVPQTPGIFTYRKNTEKYRSFGASVIEERNICFSYPLYTFCGEFGDEKYHFAFENEKILRVGFRGIYEKVCASLCEKDLDTEQRDWLEAVSAGLLAVKRVAERFSDMASEYAAASSGKDKEHYEKIAKTAKRVPWEAPQTFYEALETIVFIQSVVPALEGGNLCSAGRLDLLLYDLYLHDTQSGALSREQAYSLVAQFLLLYDLRISHDMPDQRDSYVNVRYTLGGCDRDGKPVYNDLTRLFLEADLREDIIYPMIKCRFSASSPKEYLDIVNTTLKTGKSTLLYANDGALIPAFENAGISTADARDYSLLGCWEPAVPGCSNEHCAYFSLIKIFELSVYGGLYNEKLPFVIRPLSDGADFDGVLRITLENFHAVMESRCRVAVTARAHWHKIDPHPLLSSVLDDCLEKKRDLTQGGAKYYLDEMICTGLPNVIDSLLVIKELCFDKKKYSLEKLLCAVRDNWADEDMRREALSCSFYGDESESSMRLAKLLTDDIAQYAKTLPSLWGGRVTVGYMLFMEMYSWAKKLRATPDGRRNGDYFARGLMPSDLHKINAVTGIIESVKAIDGTKIAADSVVNVTLPYGNLPLSVWEALVREAGKTGAGVWQFNCASREELLDAKEHPERHGSLVVRVCGYSAKFVSLPEYVQDDFLQRNIFS